mmetsp:Transcript_31346/g.100554  ORF Transcript_31346/g.100554 Transcript_31346/m.100554 type:complete len:84 (+) Transcript_31346:297-548(+)
MLVECVAESISKTLKRGGPSMDRLDRIPGCVVFSLFSRLKQSFDSSQRPKDQRSAVEPHGRCSPMLHASFLDARESASMPTGM